MWICPRAVLVLPLATAGWHTATVSGAIAYRPLVTTKVARPDQGGRQSEAES